MKNKEQAKLIDKIIKASNMISNSKKEAGTYIQIDKSRIEKMAKHSNVTFEEMVNILEEYFKPAQK